MKQSLIFHNLETITAKQFVDVIDNSNRNNQIYLIEDDKDLSSIREFMEIVIENKDTKEKHPWLFICTFIKTFHLFVHLHQNGTDEGFKEVARKNRIPLDGQYVTILIQREVDCGVLALQEIDNGTRTDLYLNYHSDIYPHNPF